MTKDEALKVALKFVEDTECGTADLEANIKEALAQLEFIKHEVESADDWSEWVCPNPKKYLMKCCDCGLVHEAEFAVVRYKSETEREDCKLVDDPNLQAVFRMRRSEQWSPIDTAYRPGGLAQPERCQCPACKITPHASDCAVHNAPAYPIGKCDCGAQPEQEPVAWMTPTGALYRTEDVDGCFDETHIPLYTTPPQRTWVGLTQTQVKLLWEGVPEEAIKSGDSVNWIFYTHINEALKEKNT